MVRVGKAPQLARYPAMELDATRPRADESEIDFPRGFIVLVTEGPVCLPMTLPQEEF